jgi:predicted ArsR family transcriptional regulator
MRDEKRSYRDRVHRAILDLIANVRPMTADEIADRLELSILYIRPRVSELVELGKLAPSGLCGRNASGKRAKKWKVAA